MEIFMRGWLFFLILLISIVFSSNRAVSADDADCLICEDLDGLLKTLPSSDGTLAGRDPLSAYVATLVGMPKYANAGVLEFDIHDVCDAQKITNLLRAPKAYIQQYETLMAGTQACTQACSISINKAEYCALNTALSFQISAWPRLSEAFADTAILLDMAGEADRPAITQFSVLLNGAAREAQSYLGQAMQNLVDNTPLASDDPGLVLARKELLEAGNILQVLHWTGMAGPTAKSHGKELTRLSRALSPLNADLEMALSRAQVLEPKDRQALAKRIIVLAADIAVIRQSVEHSVRALRQSEPDTNANATNRLAENALALGTAGTCLNTLAIETSLIPEFGKVVQDELNACRSFDGCSNRSSFAKPMDLQALIERIEANVGKDEKITMAVSRKICK
jgi:hypothetical protein